MPSGHHEYVLSAGTRDPGGRHRSGDRRIRFVTASLGEEMQDGTLEIEQEFADFVITTQATSETLAGHAVENPCSDNGTSFWGAE